MHQQLNLSDRIAIESGLYACQSFGAIAKKIDRHTSTISREIQANRTWTAGLHPYGKDCCMASGCRRKHLCSESGCNRYCYTCAAHDCQTLCPANTPYRCPMLAKPPFVCNTCTRRRKCKTDRAYYIAQYAQAASERCRSESRTDIHVKGDDLKALNNLVSPLVKKGQPLTHICAEHAAEIGVSQRTLYNYIDSNVFSISNMDLRRKIGYRPRKKKRTPNGFADKGYRQGRDYRLFLQYLEKNPNARIVEMDTVNGCRESGKRLLTFIFRENNLMLLFLMPDGKAQSVVQVFDQLTALLGLERFRELFGTILTDNGSEFKRVLDLEHTQDGEQRTHVYYCDPLSSWQKGHVEKNHEFIRYVIPKGKSLNPYTQADMTRLMNHMNSVKRAKLGMESPYHLATDPAFQYLMTVLNLHLIPSDEIHLKPDLLIQKD